jgi:hypothetical protein
MKNKISTNHLPAERIVVCQEYDAFQSCEYVTQIARRIKNAICFITQALPLMCGSYLIVA